MSGSCRRASASSRARASGWAPMRRGGSRPPSSNKHCALGRRARGEALTVLNARERRTFEARRLADEPITLEELADEFGVSRERVRQIEVRAFEKVKKGVRQRVGAMAGHPVSSIRIYMTPEMRPQTSWTNV